ncbi:MAG: hypothetical protein J3Q66DRAFT_401446 [Benniella sp.]|nr:MAG: hypothetical protein J3Q66DRAFT_401446 [Benniella sp.]
MVVIAVGTVVVVIVTTAEDVVDVQRTQGDQLAIRTIQSHADILTFKGDEEKGPEGSRHPNGLDPQARNRFGASMMRYTVIYSGQTAPPATIGLCCQCPRVAAGKINLVRQHDDLRVSVRHDPISASTMVSKSLILAVLFLVASNVQALPAEDGTCCIRDGDCRSGACIIGSPAKKDKKDKKKKSIKAEIGICSCIPGFEDTDEGEGPEGACCKSSDDCENTCMDGVCRGD